MATKTRTTSLLPNHHKLMYSIFVVSMQLNLLACSGDGEGTGQVIEEAAADFDSEVYSHKFWSQLSPLTESSNESLGVSDPFTEIVGVEKYSCSNDSYSLTETPKEFVSIDPDASVMWLGNLIQGGSHLQVGSLQELSIRERAPLNISIDLLRGDNYRIVEDPSLVSVNSAIGELIENAVAAGHEASSKVFYESKEAHSTSQTSLELGFTAEYLGAKAETSLSVEKQGEENSFFAYFIQNAFSVSMELPTAPHDMVSDALMQNQLEILKTKGQIGEDNPPLYISSMSYGRVLIYKMTSTHSRDRIQAAINASYSGLTSGGSGFTKAELEETLSSAKIEISAFGGNQSNIESLIRTGELKGYFTGDTKLTSMQAISFEIRNLQDNTIANISRTTKYNVKQCTHVGKTISPVGERMKVIFDKVYIPHDCDGGIDKGDIYGRFDVITTEPTGGDKTYRVVTQGETKVQSGNTLNLGSSPESRSITLDKYYGKTFRISGQLKDKDGGSRGADDIVGNWNANQFSIAGKQPGTHNKKAVSNCGGKNPTLTYRLERVDYIY